MLVFKSSLTDEENKEPIGFLDRLQMRPWKSRNYARSTLLPVYLPEAWVWRNHFQHVSNSHCFIFRTKPLGQHPRGTELTYKANLEFLDWPTGPLQAKALSLGCSAQLVWIGPACTTQSPEPGNAFTAFWAVHLTQVASEFIQSFFTRSANTFPEMQQGLASCFLGVSSQLLQFYILPWFFCETSLTAEDR